MDTKDHSKTPISASELLKKQIEHSNVTLSSDCLVKAVQCMCRQNDDSLYTQEEALLALKNPLIRFSAELYQRQFGNVLSEF